MKFLNFPLLHVRHQSEKPCASILCTDKWAACVRLKNWKSNENIFTSRWKWDVMPTKPEHPQISNHPHSTHLIALCWAHFFFLFSVDSPTLVRERPTPEVRTASAHPHPCVWSLNMSFMKLFKLFFLVPPSTHAIIAYVTTTHSRIYETSFPINRKKWAFYLFPHLTVLPTRRLISSWIFFFCVQLVGEMPNEWMFLLFFFFWGSHIAGEVLCMMSELEMRAGGGGRQGGEEANWWLR